MISDIVNTMGSGATAEAGAMLAGPVGDFIYFSLGVLIVGIGIFVFHKFSPK